MHAPSPTTANIATGNNRFFCDGHVEFEDCNKPFQDTDAYLARWNVDHLPHREAWRW